MYICWLTTVRRWKSFSVNEFLKSCKRETVLWLQFPTVTEKVQSICIVEIFTPRISICYVFTHSVSFIGVVRWINNNIFNSTNVSNDILFFPT
ncbi:hypothetical protein B2G88_18455 [Natronolimnobius baerhuensis]|uniref:Uncharacterized protein n=1 Tax=Natronolimnobius baerhuensis TaxID=253108 RepID=A0A202E4Z8_9EURY|nr:hypothetical protein B2G88_18455 [Natronolimnobius baerhuensis]